MMMPVEGDMNLQPQIRLMLAVTAHAWLLAIIAFRCRLKGQYSVRLLFVHTGEDDEFVFDFLCTIVSLNMLKVTDIYLVKRRKKINVSLLIRICQVTMQYSHHRTIL
jgi:hypothetical protein